MSHLVNDETGRTNPSINMGIPQYNALDDKSCAGYFQRKGLPKVVKKAKEVREEGVKWGKLRKDGSWVGEGGEGKREREEEANKGMGEERRES